MGTAIKQTDVNPEENRKKLHDIVEASRTVLLLSHGDAHKIDGRPMGLVKIEDDSTIYLVTNIDSNKVAEVQRDPRVSIAAQNGKGTAMIDGEMRVSQDRALIEKLWEDSWKAYFPDGKSDPTIALLIITPNEGTFWEGGVLHGLSFLWRTLKARVTGGELEVKPTDQQKVQLR